MSVADRLTVVRRRVADAARSAGRDPASVRLVAVSKTFPIDAVREAYAAGQREFGENRVQEGLQKISLSSDLEIRWHLLGHLQMNKARKAAAAFALVQSVDSVELLERIDLAAADQGARPELLIQVDLAGETTKHGAPPVDAMAIIRSAERCRAARVVGLMTIPPFFENPEQARPFFAELRNRRDTLLKEGVEPRLLQELSMGMSHDFEIAVQEGATIVRLGTAIFGERHV